MAEAEAQRSPYALAVVERPEQGGPARARNDGWRLAAAPLVAFIDDDCEATPTWLERLSAAASAAPGAVVQGRTRPNPRELEAAGPFSVTRDVDGSGARWFETCNIAYPREVLERLEGFDESFPEPLGEDTDLGWRALGAGGRRVFVDDAVVDHAVEDLGRPATYAGPCVAPMPCSSSSATRGCASRPSTRHRPQPRESASAAGARRVRARRAAGARPRCSRCRT